ncbi:MAG: hypothetical protein WC651_04325 [Candidatus Gracilibacteria bacterium]|jgi:hypothetical protein
MLDEAARKEIEETRAFQGGASLQCAYFDYEHYTEGLSFGMAPPSSALRSTHSRMRENCMHFDSKYCEQLGAKPLTVLAPEQETWTCLSPLVHDFLGRFKIFIDGYDSEQNEESKKTTLKTLLNEYWDLIQKWNVISQSYKAKEFFKSDEQVAEREQAIRALIESIKAKTKAQQEK